MRIIFGNWKYLFKNFWYILPSAILPAVFLALSRDYTAIHRFVSDAFTGNPRADFILFLRVFGILRIDGWLGAVYSLAAILCVTIATAFLLSIVEKHMRIGKRNFGGVGKQLSNILLPSFGITLFYAVIYEIWAIILSALCFAIASIPSTGAIYVLYCVAFLLTGFCLMYVATSFFLWLPCMQITGFRPYEALVYSYRLVSGVRWRLVLSFSMFFLIATFLFAGLSLVPAYLAFVFDLVAFFVYLFLFAAYCVRMETVYFETDKIDREDLLRSYREL